MASVLLHPLHMHKRPLIVLVSVMLLVSQDTFPKQTGVYPSSAIPYLIGCRA